MVLFAMLAIPGAAPDPNMKPEPVKMGKGMPGGPMGKGGPFGMGPDGKPGKLMTESNEMHHWFCEQPGNEEKMPCLLHAARNAPDKEERAKLQAKLKEHTAGMKGKSLDKREDMMKMHEGWCAKPENAKSQLCENWAKSRSRREETAEKRDKNPPNHSSEYVEMHNAWCDEKPENAETSPCLMHRMRYSSKVPEERKALQEQMKAVTPETRMKEREDMMKFWCEDSTTKRSESGVCLSWLKRKQMPDLHSAEKMKEMKEKHKPPTPEDLNPRMSEMEKMHEWYCTKLDGTYSTLVCARWRLRLKQSIEAYDAAAREKDQAMVKEFSETKGAEMSALAKKVHEAKEAANVEEHERLQAELKKVRHESQAGFFEMHRRWCEDGAGKDDPDSAACKRWREHMNKAEL